MDSNNQHGGDNDELPKDDGSIEVISESGDSLSRNLDWSIYSAGGNSAAGSDVDSMDFQKLSMHSKMARIIHHDGRQFIESRDLDDGGLPYSAEFYVNDEMWKLNGEDCLLMSHRRYIAEVKVEGRIKMEETINFEEAARILLKQVKIMNVFRDVLLDECDKAKTVLQMILDELAGEPGKTNEHKRDILELRILLQKHGNALTRNFMHDLKNCASLSPETMSALNDYVTKTLKLLQRNEVLCHSNDPLISDDFINGAIEKSLTIHRARLAVICPSTLTNEFEKLPDDSIMHISMEDMQLFADLTTLDHRLLQFALPLVFSKFLIKAQELNDKKLVDHTPMTSPIYLYICKSLLDIVEQFEAHIENDSVIMYSVERGWEVTSILEDNQIPNGKHLRQQLQMIAAIANHFEPGGPFRTSRFPYEFKLLQNMDAVPEPVRIWLCLLDHCMKDLVQAESDKMQMLTCFFRSFVSSIASEELQGETLECLRTITHEALRSMAGIEKSCERNCSSSNTVNLEENVLEVIDIEPQTVNDTPAPDCTHSVSTDIGKAMESTPAPLESSTSEERSTISFEKYSAQLNVYLLEAVRFSRDELTKRIVSDVISKVELQVAAHWTEEILAGLSAVWSLIVSQSDSGLDTLKRPSRLQIDCILDFFSNQDHKDDDLHRLVYLSSQQGKDLVLGMIAAILALNGHMVLIACYNSNLTRIASTHLIHVFTRFSIHSNILFVSIEDMARERSRKGFGKYAAYARKCLGLDKEPIESKLETDNKSFVLLIDDIDLFLQNKTLGQAFKRYLRPNIPGLAYVDETKRMCTVEQIFHPFSSTMVGSDSQKLRVLWEKYSCHKLFGFSENTNNQTFIIEHFKNLKRNMNNSDVENFRISSKGALKAKAIKEDGVFDYVYFALRDKNYQQTADGYKNYGFINLGCFHFPYAHLLRSFPLVLGFVSAPLDDDEIITLQDHYQFNPVIAKPNLSRVIPVKFDPKKDFRCVDSNYKRDWMVAIMVAINAAIRKNCSVLVFFTSEVEMEQFQGSFANHLKSYSVTVIDTASNGAYFSELQYEVAVDEVTVLVIDAKGLREHPAEDRPVHVIQTFWSCDIKEENLIRKQAERWHSSGSYELVVFKEPPEYKADARDRRSYGDAFYRLDQNMKLFINFEEFCKNFGGQQT